MAVAAGPSLNGTPSNNFVNEILEYEKIISLRDQIFAGSHPRLTVPAHAIRKVSPLPPPLASQPQTVVLFPFSSEPSNVKLPGLHLGPNARVPSSTLPPVNPFPSQPPVSNPQPQPTRSGIDPALLIKADVLVRAETVLHRGRLEKSLKEQFERKRADARRYPHPQETKPDFDVSAALARALEVAKPDLLAKPATPSDAASASDSFDENSFYSSKAPDSTPEEGVRRRPSPPTKHQVHPMDVDDLDADRQVDRRARNTQADMNDSPYKTSPRPDYQTVSNVRPPYLPWQDRNMPQGSNTVDLTAMDLDEDDEPEYSPPEPMEQFPTMSPNVAHRTDNRELLRRPLRRYSELDQNGNGYGSPPRTDMRIVRNHITSPLAPQPSRVSPLAIAKAPPFSQNNSRTRKERNRPYQNGRPESRSSPEASAPAIQPKKRRKLDKKKGRGRNGEQFIKDEPVSPPPFLEKRPLVPVVQNRPQDSRSGMLEDPRQEVIYLPSQDRYVPPSPRVVTYEAEPPMSYSVPRPHSRLARPVLRDDQDLRKVASMHSLRAERPRDYAETVYESPSRTRATSYAIVERDSQTGQSRIYQDSFDSYEQPPMQESRVVGSPAPTFRDPETGVRYERRPMMPPPPQRRIIQQDAYGREIVYEVVAPRQPTQVETDSYNEQAYVRNRATSVFAEQGPEKRYVQDMPPPAVTYRRVAESPFVAPAEARSVAREQTFDPSRIQRSASVQVVDYPSRQHMYLSDRMEPRQIRMSSVRPPAYEEVQPREIVQRVQSVRPGGREGSVFLDERAPVRREYAQVEQPRYRTVVQDGRYYEVQDREPVMIEDDGEDGRPRVIQRY